MSHYQGRCAFAENLWDTLCCRRRQRLQQARGYPPDAVIVLTTTPRRVLSFRTRKKLQSMVAVVVNPDKTCQVGLSDEALNTRERPINYFTGKQNSRSPTLSLKS